MTKLLHKETTVQETMKHVKMMCEESITSLSNRIHDFTPNR